MAQISSKAQTADLSWTTRALVSYQRQRMAHNTSIGQYDFYGFCQQVDFCLCYKKKQPNVCKDYCCLSEVEK